MDRSRAILYETIFECLNKLMKSEAHECAVGEQIEDILSKIRKMNPKVYVAPRNIRLDSLRQRKLENIKFTPKLPKCIASQLQRCILMCGASLRGLERASGVPNEIISQWCNGSLNKIEQKYAYKLAKATGFEVKPWDLNPDIAKTTIEEEESSFNFFEE